jgi:YbbR domain-containing protein
LSALRLLLDNLALKSVSLVLAVLLWFLIAAEKTSERGLSVPVEFQNVPKDLEMTNDPVDTVEVRLRASPGIIQGLLPRELSAQIDLAGTVEGERIIHLTPDTVRVPFGVRVVKVTPSIVTLTFERTLEKVVPIRPRLVGRPAPGYEVAEVVADPAEVRIVGPRSRVQEVESAFTEPISVDVAQSSVTESVAVGLEDPLLRLGGTSRVRVTARVREVQEKRVFEAAPVEVRGGTAQPRPASVRITVTGPASVLQRLQKSDCKAYVTVRDDAAPRVPVSVEVASGFAGVSVVAVEPPEITLRTARKSR